MKKRFLALLVIIILAAGILSGCTTAEKDFNKVYLEASSLELSEFSGEILFNLSALPDISESEDDAIVLELLKNTLNSYKITYQGRLDTNNQLMEYYFTLTNRSTGEERELTTLICSGSTMYLKVDGLVSFIKLFGDSEMNEELDSAFANVEYLVISTDDFAKFANPSGSPIAGSLWYQNGSIFETSKKQQLIWQTIFNDFLVKAFDNYQTGIVKKEGSKYSLSVDPAGLVEMIQSMLIYSVNNIEKIGSCASDALTNLSDEEITLLGLDPEMRDYYELNIQQLVNDVTANKSQYLAQLDTLDELIANEIKYFDGTKFTMSIQKKGTDTYESSAQIKIVFSDPDNPEDKLDCSLESKGVVSAGEPFTVTPPTSGVITLKELEQRTAQVFKIKTGAGTYTLTKGDKTLDEGTTGVKIINNYTYLPLRQVAESLNETVTWDGTAKKAYVERYGLKIDMTGTIIDNSTYIKIRDFEQLGYQVQWEAETKTVTIIKKGMF